MFVVLCSYGEGLCKSVFTEAADGSAGDITVKRGFQGDGFMALKAYVSSLLVAVIALFSPLVWAEDSVPSTQPGTAPLQQAKANVPSTGIERADGERLATAVGYYSRARAHLLEALRSFDEARRYADPSVLIDTEEWRSTLISRAEELERVMSPQPRASKGGVKFPSASQLLSTDQKGEEY